MYVKNTRRLLAWVLPALATLFTLAFFVSMASGASWVSITAFCRYGSIAIVAAFLIQSFIALCVWLYGRLSTAAERRFAQSGTTPE